MSMHSASVVTSLIPVSNNGANWVRLINDQRFWQDAIQTTRFAFISVTIEVLLALAIALLINQEWKGRGVVRSLTILPWALPTTVMALGWRWIFNTPYGPIDQITGLLSLGESNILSNPSFSWISTVIADCWKTTPFVALIILAGLQTIPKDLYEAFYIEGGKPINALFNITIPLLKPYILISIIFRMAQAYGVFELIQVMTGGGPAGTTESLALYAYLNAMRFLDFGYSSTIMLASFLLLIISCLLSWLLLRNINILLRYNS